MNELSKRFIADRISRTKPEGRNAIQKRAERIIEGNGDVVKIEDIYLPDGSGEVMERRYYFSGQRQYSSIGFERAPITPLEVNPMVL